MIAGNLEQAELSFRDCLNNAAKNEIQQDILGSSLFLAEINCEHDEFAEARQQLDKLREAVEISYNQEL